MIESNKISEDKERSINNPREVVHQLAIESLSTFLKDRIEELNDETATNILTRLDEFAALILKADKSYYEVMGLIVDDELEIINNLGYSYMKNPDGSIEFYSTEDISHSRAEPDKTPLTEADYYAVLDQMSENFHKNGIPSKYKIAYSHLKETFQELLNCDVKFNMAMEQARPYLHSLEGMFLIIQYYTYTQLLQSIINMFESY